jgi:fatty-acyl-CoA synthase
MKPEDYVIWPKGMPRSLTIPHTTLWYNLEVAATRYPDKPAIIFYDSRLTYREFRSQAEALAGFLQQRCGVGRGERVLLDMQNSPQFVLAYYAILRADAVVVPVSPMNVTAGHASRWSGRRSTASSSPSSARGSSMSSSPPTPITSPSEPS